MLNVVAVSFVHSHIAIRQYEQVFPLCPNVLRFLKDRRGI